MERVNGLLVGLSSFHGTQDELPFVGTELGALSQMLGPHGQALTEQDASWQKLLSLKRDGVFSTVAWLHIASHFLSDRQTGRLSGLVLSDGNVFLDQIRDLAPLPALVSLSACNSNDSFLFEGDERVDLQTTCLIAGANTVVGSAWPLIDESAAELTVLFFKRYFAGSSPSQVAVQAQRQMIESGKPLEAWASFVCAGMP
jgi:CHAT domain-containing protein